MPEIGEPCPYSELTDQPRCVCPVLCTQNIETRTDLLRGRAGEMLQKEILFRHELAQALPAEYPANPAAWLATEAADLGLLFWELETVQLARKKLEWICADNRAAHACARRPHFSRD